VKARPFALGRLESGPGIEQMKIFTSFGNTSRFPQSLKRIHYEATKFGFDRVQIYTEQDLHLDYESCDFDSVKHGRGFGFMIWKPWVIYDLIQKSQEGDIIIYADAGCTIQNTPKAKQIFQSYIDQLNNDKCWIRFQLHLAEEEYTTDAIFNYFGANHSSIRTSGQYISGINIFKVCPRSVLLCRAWLDAAKKDYTLFTDSHNHETKLKRANFKDNRHDQSVFSVISKIEPYLHYVIPLIDKTYDFTYAPSDEPFLATRIRK